MTQRTIPLRRAACLLLSAAALPLTPAFAQEAQPPQEPVAEVPAPAPAPAPAPEPAPAPDPAPAATTAPAPVAETAPPAATRTAPRRTAQPRAAARTAPPPASRTAASAPAPVAAAPAPAPVEAAAPAAAPAGEAVPPAVELPPAPAAAPAAPAQQAGGGIGSMLPWLLAGLAALGALAFVLMRRRRRAAASEEQWEETPAEHTAYAAADVPGEDRSWAPAHELAVAEPVAPAAAAAPSLTAAAAAAHEAPAAAAAPVETGRPKLDLDLRPRRAGVTGEEAVVEFDLSVDNHGSAAAQDVRVTAWMFPAGAGSQSEMEKALIERPGEASLPPIEPGSAESMTAAVTLPTSSVPGDAVLPVVVAEARYRLPDGSEGRTTASYAVGVPDGDDLAHFSIDNPSGLHEEVVARQMEGAGQD